MYIYIHTCICTCVYIYIYILFVVFVFSLLPLGTQREVRVPAAQASSNFSQLGSSTFSKLPATAAAPGLLCHPVALLFLRAHRRRHSGGDALSASCNGRTPRTGERGRGKTY